MSGGQKSADTTTTKTELPAEYKPYISDILKQGQYLYNNYNPQVRDFSGVAGMSPGMQSGSSQLVNFGDSSYNQNILRGMQDGMENLQQLGQSTGDPTARDTATSVVNGTNQYLDGMVDSALKKNTQSFMENAMPAIQDDATGSGQYGGSRQGVAEGVAMGKLADANANTAAQLYYQGAQADVNNRLNAAGMLNGMDNWDRSFQLNANNSMMGFGSLMQQMGTYGANTALQGGQVDQNYRQAVLDDYINRYDQSQQLPLDMANFYAGLIYGAPHGGTTTSTGPEYKTGGMQGALGGAATGASVGSAFGPWGTAIGAVGGGIIGSFG